MFHRCYKDQTRSSPSAGTVLRRKQARRCSFRSQARRYRCSRMAPRCSCFPAVLFAIQQPTDRRLVEWIRTATPIYSAVPLLRTCCKAFATNVRNSASQALPFSLLERPLFVVAEKSYETHSLRYRRNGC